MRRLSSLKVLIFSFTNPPKSSSSFSRAFSSLSISRNLSSSSRSSNNSLLLLPSYYQQYNQKSPRSNNKGNSYYNTVIRRNMVQGVRIDDENCLVNTNPATGALISKVKCTTSEELEEIIRTADTAQKLVWRNKSIQERIDLLKDCITELVAVSNPMIVSIVTEMGKPIGEATEEVQYAVEDQEEYFEILMESITPKSYGKNTVVRQPYGVVAIISPWNFPLGEIMLLALPSLASGNTVIVKPSEVVPETALLLVQTMQKCLPAGVIQIAQGTGSVGAALVSHPRIDLVAMTGSSATGRKILQAAAPQLKRVILEMGGKDPMIVCEDADLDKAAQDAVMYSLSNTGQVCCSIERIYVADSVYDKFQSLAKLAAQKYLVGNGMDPQNKVGPMVSRMQMELVREQVDDAVAKGAKIIHQSEIPSATTDDDQHNNSNDAAAAAKNSNADGGSFYPVTVVADVNDTMQLFTEETFGPVVAIAKFDGTEEEAIRLANDTEYGLGSSVYTKDSKKAERIASLIDAGQVGVNCYPLEAMGFHCPWVGHKNSGFGYHSGADGHLQFSIPKTICRV